MERQLSERDLDSLIEEHLEDCSAYSNICVLTRTQAGKQRLRERVKEIMFNDGLTDIEAILAQIESQLLFDQ